MRIVHINSYYAAGKFYKFLYDRQQLEHSLCVYVPLTYGNAKQYKDMGEYTLISENHNKYDRILFHLKHEKIFRDAVKKDICKDADIIHAHSLFSNGIIAMRLSQMYGIPYVVAVRNTDVNVFFKYMIHLRSLGINILENASKIIFLSQPYKDMVLNTYVGEAKRAMIEAKCAVIPNGIDPFWLSSSPENPRETPEGTVRLFYAGSIDKNKNLTTAVKAAQLLKESGIDITYTAAGKVANENVLAEIQKYNFVKYIGAKTRDEMIECYRNADIFIMPSFTETFGLVYAEAMSQGLPVIYSAGQGFDGQFKQGYAGYAVDPHDTGDISENIKDIINKYTIISANCLQGCRKFDWDKISTEYSDIYSDIKDRSNIS